MSASQRYAFGDFVLERSQQRVRRRDGSALNLSPRLFSALLLFVENAGALLDKDALMRALWPGLVVEENSLSQVVSGLRRALADDPRQPLHPDGAPPRLQVHRPGDSAAGPVGGQERRRNRRGKQRRGCAATRAGPSWRLRPARRQGLAHALRSGGAGWAWLRGAAGLGAIGLWRRGARRSRQRGALSTLAVLPFKPLAADARDELLEVGMADSLIARLSTVPGLVVRSVGSVRRYAGAEQDPLRAARDLDVAWIVDGSLQRRGDQLRVTARLLRAAEGSAAWSGSFDEKFTGVFEVQDMISARVAKVLAPSLEAFAGAHATGVGSSAARATPTPTSSIWRRLDTPRTCAPMVCARASSCTGRRWTRPGYALAWVGLAETIGAGCSAPTACHRRCSSPPASRSSAPSPWSRTWPKRVPSRPSSCTGSTSTGRAPNASFRRALAINPNVAMAHFGLASLLLNQDRPDEGFVQMRTARELDPMSPVYNTLEAAYLLEAGAGRGPARLNRALESPRRSGSRMHAGASSSSPTSSPTPSRTCVGGRWRTARRDPAPCWRFILRGSARSTRRARSSTSCSPCEKTRYVPPSSLAAVYAALGEVGPALDALDRAFLTRDTRLTFLKDDPRLASLRKEPRFVALMRKLKLDRFGPGLAPL